MRSLQELAQLARSKPGELSWSSGPSLPHFVFAAMLTRHALKAGLHPLPGCNEPADGLRRGARTNPLPCPAGGERSGGRRQSADTRRDEPSASRGLPDVPTVVEAGFPEMEIEGLTGLFGWRDMPPALRDRISADVRAVAGDPSVRSRIEAGGQHVLGSTPGIFRRHRTATIAHSADQPHRRFKKCGEIGGVRDGNGGGNENQLPTQTS